MHVHARSTKLLLSYSKFCKKKVKIMIQNLDGFFQNYFCSNSIEINRVTSGINLVLYLFFGTASPSDILTNLCPVC